MESFPTVLLTEIPMTRVGTSQTQGIPVVGPPFPPIWDVPHANALFTLFESFALTFRAILEQPFGHVTERVCEYE